MVADQITLDEGVMRLVGGKVTAREIQALELEYCVIYVRVSTEKQETLEEQEAACRLYALHKGYRVLRVFSEKKSGLDRDRPQFQKMLALAQQRKFKHVIIFLTDRFGRDAAGYVQDAQDLERLGIQLHTSAGKIEPELVPLYAMLSNHVSRAISAHVTNKARAGAAAGKLAGTPAFGYRALGRGQREIVRAEAAVMQECYRRAASGSSSYEVTRYFNDATGENRRATTIRRMLVNPIYMGVSIRFRQQASRIRGRGATDPSTWIITSQPHLAIVKETLWREANARRLAFANQGQRTHERRKGARYPLTGLLRCAACYGDSPRRSDKDIRVQGKKNSSHANSPTNEDAESFNYCYFCSGCYRSRNAAAIEKPLQEKLASIPIEPRDIAAQLKALAHGRDTTAKKIQSLERKIREAEHLKLRYIEMRGRDTITDDELVQARFRADTQIEKCQADIDALSVQQPNNEAIEERLTWLSTISSWTEALTSQPPATQNEIYRRSIAYIHIDWKRRTLTVHWQPAIALLLGEEESVLSTATRWEKQRTSHFLPFHEARAVAQGLRLGTRADYLRLAHSGELPAGLPLYPNEAYHKDGWQGWPDFLRAGRPIHQWMPFTQALAMTRTLKLRDEHEWRQWAASDQRPDTMPTDPEVTYKKCWRGWSYFIGNERGQERWASYEDALAVVRSLGLSGEDEWKAWARSNQRPLNIPSSPSTVYAGRGWQSWSHWFGTTNRSYKGTAPLFDPSGKLLVSDAAWALIEPILPIHPAAHRGGPRPVHRRAILGGIIYLVRNNLPWDAPLPEALACVTARSCRKQLRRWHEMGVWQSIRAVLELHLPDGKAIDWNRANLRTVYR